MKISFSKTVDGVAIAVLVFTAATQIYGAYRDSARYASLAIAALCLLFCAAIWRKESRAKRWVGVLLVMLSIGVGLAAWRFHFLLPFGAALTAAYLVTGILMIGMNRTDRVQQGGGRVR